MCERKRTWLVVLLLAALAGCAGGAPRLSQCAGKAVPINVSTDAGGDERGR